MNALDRMLMAVAPKWALSRARARQVASLLSRHYEAAAPGRRTSGWNKSSADVNAALSGSLPALRGLSRDLVRNNPWARRGLQVIASNTVGWGIVPKFTGPLAARVSDVWRTWAETPECDADGRLTFYALQKQVVRTMAEAGEVLIRRRIRREADGLSAPMQLQVLEPDFLDTSQDKIRGQQGGWIIQGVEHDAIGRRVAYWLFNQHPGSATAMPVSSRVPADNILHIFQQERPGQVRGIPWFAPIIVRLRDFDEYEDAKLMQQKIAACFAAFVTDDGSEPALGQAGTDASSGKPIDTLEPGMIEYLPPGREVSFATPPAASDASGLATGTLRAIAAGLGITYEDMTGDYSQVNYSSGRMGRIAHWSNVHSWRWDVVVPQLCQPVVNWLVQAISGMADTVPTVWTPPPAPMIDPDKEGLALMRMVRTGAMTHDQMVREQGMDPDDHWRDYADGLKRLDRLGIKLDSDPRNMTQGGVQQAQQQPQQAKPATNGKSPGAAETPAGADATPQAEA